MKSRATKILCVLAAALSVSAVIVVSNTKQSTADIIDLAGVSGRDDTEFVRVLESLGHDRFDVYEVNGQTIYTSVRHEPTRSPISLLQDYQRELVAHGVNDRAYFDLSSGDPEDRLFTGLKGGLVPFKVGERHVAMGGVITQRRAISDDEVIRDIDAMLDRPQGFRGHRTIEIMRPEGSNRSTVVATWAEEFDFDEFQPGSESMRSREFEEDIASCPSCTRVHHLAHPRRQTVDKGVHLFMGPRSTSFYRDWYRDEFESQGWKLEPNHHMTTNLKTLHGPGMPNEWMSFRRDGWVRTVAIYDLGSSESGIHVHTEASSDIDDENEE